MLTRNKEHVCLWDLSSCSLNRRDTIFENKIFVITVTKLIIYFHLQMRRIQKKLKLFNVFLFESDIDLFKFSVILQSFLHI